MEANPFLDGLKDLASQYSIGQYAVLVVGVIAGTVVGIVKATKKKKDK